MDGTSAVRLRCPSCGGKSFTVYERLEVAHVFRVEQGSAQLMRRSEDLPMQIGFSADCDCGHTWVPKRASALRVMDAEAAGHGYRHGYRGLR